MFYVIQTDISMDENGQEKDFQSRIFQVNMGWWLEFSAKVFNDNIDDWYPKITTMSGKLRPPKMKYKQSKVFVEGINNIAVLYHNEEDNIYFKSMFYLVEKDKFNNLLGDE